MVAGGQLPAFFLWAANQTHDDSRDMFHAIRAIEHLSPKAFILRTSKGIALESIDPNLNTSLLAWFPGLHGGHGRLACAHLQLFERVPPSWKTTSGSNC